MAAESFEPTQYRWSYTPVGKPFDGCIRNIVHNSKLYDLADPGLFRYSKVLYTDIYYQYEYESIIEMMVVFPKLKKNYFCYFSLAVVQWKMLAMETETFQTLQDVASMEDV